jgi:hypothetical protein
MIVTNSSGVSSLGFSTQQLPKAERSGHLHRRQRQRRVPRRDQSGDANGFAPDDGEERRFLLVALRSTSAR